MISRVLDWRYATDAPAAFEQQLCELTTGLNIEYALPPAWSRGPEDTALHGPAWVNTPGFLTEPGHPLVRMAQTCLSDAPPPGVWRFATDGRYSARQNLPTVGCGPGDERLIHTAGEALDLRQVPPYLAFLDRLLRAALSVNMVRLPQP